MGSSQSTEVKCKDSVKILKDEFDIDCGKDCDYKEAVRKYRRQTIIHHPDKGGDPIVFKRLQEAKELVIDDKCVEKLPQQQYRPPPPQQQYRPSPQQQYRPQSPLFRSRYGPQTPPPQTPPPISLDDLKLYSYLGKDKDINKEEYFKIFYALTGSRAHFPIGKVSTLLRAKAFARRILMNDDVEDELYSLNDDDLLRNIGSELQIKNIPNTRETIISMILKNTLCPRRPIRVGGRANKSIGSKNVVRCTTFD
jgi:hypothetical protein